MNIAAIAADPTTAAAYQQARRASYPPLTAHASAPAQSPTLSSGNPALSVEIPAPAETKPETKPETLAFRSAKGGLRSDLAAPPTTGANGESFDFADLIDVINPLQHVPGVNLAYRYLTGDAIKPAENVAGGFLFGGALGGMAAIAMSMLGELSDGSADAAASPVTLAQSQPGKFGGGTAMPGVLG